MKLSIVATLYHSAPYIAEFHHRVTASANQLVGNDYEIVFVNDGSPDDSLALAVQLASSDNHVSVIDLSRNFGHHKAMMTGLAHTCGERVFLIDTDLEESPEWMLEFDRQMIAQRNDVVYGVQSKRKGNLVEKTSGAIFYKIFRLLTGINQPNNIVTARLMSRRYVDALLSYKERELNIGGLWILTGFSQSQQTVNKRSSSPTTYSFARKFDHLINAITSFSSLPLMFTFYAGLAIALSATSYIAILVVKYLFVSTPPDGYTSIIASIWLFSGLIILFMGIQGIYIAKIFSESKQRPLTTIRHIYRPSSMQDLP